MKKRRARSSRRALFVVLGFALLAGIAWLAWRKSAPEPPPISTANLDASAAALIEQNLRGVRQSPRSGDAWGKLGAILKSFGFREQAAFCLQEAERLDPKEARWPYLLATLQLTDPSVALPKLRRAVALCGNDPEMPRLRLARLLAETAEQDAAGKELQELLRAKPNFAPAQLLLAQICHTRGELEQAGGLAKACTTNAYTARSAWTLLSALHRRRGDTNAAELAARRAAAVTADAPWPDPFEEESIAGRNDARSLSDRAQSYLLAGRATEAMPLVNRMVRDHPSFPETWLLLGRAQYLQKQPVAAEESLRRFLQMDPESVNGNFQLGMSLMAQQRFEEAAATFQHAISLKRDFGPAYFNLGFALAKSGKPRDAIPAFQEAIRHNPEIMDSYILLADLHLQVGEKAQAAEVASVAERLNPADPRLPTLRQKLGKSSSP